MVGVRGPRGECGAPEESDAQPSVLPQSAQRAGTAPASAARLIHPRHSGHSTLAPVASPSQARSRRRPSVSRSVSAGPSVDHGAGAGGPLSTSSKSRGGRRRHGLRSATAPPRGLLT
jgi:hypothetical protein